MKGKAIEAITKWYQQQIKRSIGEMRVFYKKKKSEEDSSMGLTAFSQMNHASIDALNAEMSFLMYLALRAKKLQFNCRGRLTLDRISLIPSEFMGQKVVLKVLIELEFPLEGLSHKVLNESKIGQIGTIINADRLGIPLDQRRVALMGEFSGQTGEGSNYYKVYLQWQ
jgi:hypothetical protein